MGGRCENFAPHSCQVKQSRKIFAASGIHGSDRKVERKSTNAPLLQASLCLVDCDLLASAAGEGDRGEGWLLQFSFS
jgi:hypothetical protein